MELTHHLIVYIVQDLHKKLLKTNLLKLIYLIDLEYFKKKGKQASNFDYIYYKKGPWTPQFDQTLSELQGFEIKSIKKKKLETAGKFCIFCKGPAPRFHPALPPDLKEIVDRILFTFKETPQKDLLQYVYSIEPMRSTKFKEKIDFSKIFPQPHVDPEIEQAVSEANKEYESTNFPRMLASWIKESFEGSQINLYQGPRPRYCLFNASYSSTPVFRTHGPFPTALESLVEKGISLSEEILGDREES